MASGRAVLWWRCCWDHVFPAVQPSPGDLLVCPAYNSDEDEYCLTTFIYMPYETLELAKAGGRPIGEKWAPWAR